MDGQVVLKDISEIIPLFINSHLFNTYYVLVTARLILNRYTEGKKVFLPDIENSSHVYN